MRGLALRPRDSAEPAWLPTPAWAPQEQTLGGLGHPWLLKWSHSRQQPVTGSVGQSRLFPRGAPLVLRPVWRSVPALSSLRHARPPHRERLAESRRFGALARVLQSWLPCGHLFQGLVPPLRGPGEVAWRRPRARPLLARGHLAGPRAPGCLLPISSETPQVRIFMSDATIFRCYIDLKTNRCASLWVIWALCLENSLS